jgi:type II restriction enzyme
MESPERLTGHFMRGNSMSDARKSVEDLLEKVQRGEIDPRKTHLVWDRIVGYKDSYVKENSEQSWHVFIGNIFQKMVYSILKGYFTRLKSEKEEFQNLTVFSESEVKSNQYVSRKLAIKYGECLLLPDTDMAIVDFNFADPWKLEVLAIISCKTSLRERIAQACYWKLKLLSCDITKNVHVFLATTDNDEDFFVSHTSGQYGGRSRNRIIAEYELDGIYILRGDFRQEWESNKVKHYEKIFNDLVDIFKEIHRSV